MPEIIVKEPGEKLLRLALEMAQDGAISSIRISGDFFLHPEEALEEIECRLVGLEPNDELEPFIFSLAAELSVEMIGISPGSLARAIRAAADKSISPTP